MNAEAVGEEARYVGEGIILVISLIAIRESVPLR